MLDDDKTLSQALQAAAWSPAHTVLAAVWAVRLNSKDGAAKAGSEQGFGWSLADVPDSHPGMAPVCQT